jgi:hypothetical protein
MLIKVKPKDGLNVRNPQSGAVIDGEIYIEKLPSVVRLLKDGDLIEVSETAKPAKKAKAQAQAPSEGDEQ